MGFRGQFARAAILGGYVRIGSKADISARPTYVRFTAKSGHSDGPDDSKPEKFE